MSGFLYSSSVTDDLPFTFALDLDDEIASLYSGKNRTVNTRFL